MWRVLLREQEDGSNHPVCYWSQTFKEKKQNLSTTHGECLAIIRAVTLYRPYLEETRFKIQTDYEAFRWILTTAWETEKQARWCLRLSELEIDIVHGAGVKQKTADELSRPKTNGSDETLLDDEVLVLTFLQQIFACGPRTNTTNPEFVEEREGPFILFIPELHMIPGITDDQKSEIPMLPEFITAQASDMDCQQAFTSVENPNTRSNDDSERVLVRVLPLDDASQRVMSAFLRPRSSHTCHYSLLAGTLASVECAAP